MQVEASLKILRKMKKAIGWQMCEIHGIHPTLCMKMIFMKGRHKSIMQSYQWLNPMMKNVMHKKGIKWLDAGIIYLISDSKWVNLVQCKPKKGGVMVITSEKNELIPAR